MQAKAMGFMHLLFEFELTGLTMVRYVWWYHFFVKRHLTRHTRDQLLLKVQSSEFILALKYFVHNVKTS